ncbi:MAG: hypothetical protein GF317_16590 [Candidatus Lokiarchaeota archaeon]|nr:hypothetical protein [Candidatus Lokiarchaeota archaeon]MBD3201138.1 hypothetical protein [Candidatus Lokiarchaeota archaeon]
MGRRICFFGSYKPLESEVLDVEQIGYKLAKEGYEIISGGFGGTMEQISKGAKEAGGKTIGITCYIFPGKENGKANKFIDTEFVTEDIFSRIKMMIEMANAFIILPGGTGTLLEFSAVVEHINKGLLDFKPVIFVGDHWKKLLPILESITITNKKLKADFKIKRCNELVKFVNSKEDLIESLNDIFS